MLLISLGAHVVLLTLPLDQPLPEGHESVRSIRLVPLPNHEHPVEPSHDPVPESELDPPPRLPPPGDSSERSLPDDREPTPRPYADPSAADPPPPPTRLRQQVLELAGQALEADAQKNLDESLGISRPPRLPGNSGWMNAYVGTVAAGTERWAGSDGSMNSRTVLSSGQVICASIRPPTVQEFFNPWMSTAVAMIRDCGRERPGPPDGQNPWQRQPPRPP
jgi:hypothetical protein